MSIDCESTIEDSHGTYGQPILQAKQTVKSDVFSVFCQSTAPVLPNPVCVPEFVIVAPAGIVIVSPLSPN